MASFEEISQILLSRSPLPSLLAPPAQDKSKRVSSTPWNPSFHQAIENCNQSLFTKASLHLLNDDIGSCHDIVEKHSGDALADYLHYMLHRREGDYWNAKWWIRQLTSEQFQSVYLTDKYQSFGSDKSANNLSEARKRAQTFVDRCEQVERENNEDERNLLKQLQWDEMKTVFNLTRK